MKSSLIPFRTVALSIAVMSANPVIAQQAPATVAEPVAAPVTPAPAAPVAAPVYPAAQVQLPGALPGTTAADQNGDGVVDGYYTSDGFYQPFVAPAVQPVRAISRRGERG